MPAGKMVLAYKGTGRKSRGNPKGKIYRTPALKRLVRKEIRKNIEVKRSQLSWDEVSVSTLNQSPDTYLKKMTTISAGTAADQRIGQEVKVIGVGIRGIIRNNASFTNYVRVIIYKPRNYSDTADSSLLELGTADTPVTTGATGLNAMYYSANKDKVTVLFDKTYSLAAANLLGETKQVKIFKKLNNKVRWSQYNDTEPSRGNIHAAIFAAEAPDDTGSGTVVEMSAVLSTWFTDC